MTLSGAKKTPYLQGKLSVKYGWSDFSCFSLIHLIYGISICFYGGLTYISSKNRTINHYAAPLILQTFLIPYHLIPF